MNLIVKTVTAFWIMQRLILWLTLLPLDILMFCGMCNIGMQISTAERILCGILFFFISCALLILNYAVPIIRKAFHEAKKDGII